MISRVYKGHEILFDEPSETWRYGGIVDASLKKVITEVEKNHVGDYPRRPVYVYRSWTSDQTVVLAEMTSVLKGERECWIAYEDGTRAKEPTSAVYAVTLENEQIVHEMETNATAIKMLKDDIMDGLKRLTKIQL